MERVEDLVHISNFSASISKPSHFKTSLSFSFHSEKYYNSSLHWLILSFSEYLNENRGCKGTDWTNNLTFQMWLYNLF